MKKLIQRGVVEDGKLRIIRQSQFEAGLVFFDGPVVVTVERETRTLRQNAFYHLWNGIIERELGWSQGDAHEHNKIVCNTKVLYLPDVETGELVETKIGASTARMSIDAFCEYMDRVRLYWQMEHNIGLPDANTEETGEQES